MKLLKRPSYIARICALCLLIGLSTTMTAYAATPGSVGAWTTNTNSLPQALQDSASANSNGYVYILGGQTSGGTQVNTVYYAPLNAGGSVGTWTTSPNTLPQNVSYATAKIYNGYVYVMGGYNGTNNVTTVYYAALNSTTGSVGTWTTNANALPQGLSNATSIIHNGYIYVMTGTNGGSYLSTVYYAPLNANGSVGTWTTNTNPIPQALVLPSSFAYNGNVYILGGYTTGATESNTIYYAPLNANGSVGTWTTNTSVLTQGVYAAASAVYNGYAFMMGGNASSGAISSVYSAPINTNGSIGAWTASTNSLPQTLSYATSTTYNGYTYTIGGGFANGNVYYAPLTGYPTPGVSAQTASVTSGSSVAVAVLSGATGNPDPASLQITTAPAHGTATAASGTITYTPTKGYVGSDSLTYQVCSLSDEFLCTQSTISFTVAAAVVSVAASTPDTGFGTTHTNAFKALAPYGLAATVLVIGVVIYRKYTSRQPK
jgi:N-acetylneuraminic acid mutarotase